MHLLLEQHLPPRTHTHTHLLTFRVHHFAVAMPRANCPGTAGSLRLHTICCFFGSLSVAHTNIFSFRRLAVLSLPHFCLTLLSVTHTHSQTHTEFSPPPLLTVLTEREASISRVISLSGCGSSEEEYKWRMKLWRRMRRRQEAWDGNDEWP